jgi:uncharacterized delta-60 repeat protein
MGVSPMPHPMEPLEPRRLLASPQLDLTFGEGGISTLLTDTRFAGDFFLVHELSNHKVLAIGALPDSGDEPFLARLNPDGTPDATFATNGVLEIAGPHARDAVLLEDGKILLISDNVNKIIFNRFNADGTLDTGFGESGAITLAFDPTENAGASAIAQQPDGKIVFGHGHQPRRPILPQAHERRRRDRQHFPRWAH